MRQMEQISSYGIYGSALPEFDAAFLHYERIEDQLPFHDWKAGAHMHEGLDQFLFFTQGSGRLVLDGESHDFVAPVLMFMPSGTVHGFVFSQDVRAPIITAATPFMDAALLGMEARLLSALHRPQLIYLDNAARELLEVQTSFGIVEREYPEPALGRQSVMAAALRLLVTTIGRMADQNHTAVAASDVVQADIFASFMRELEARFKRQPRVSELADILGLTAARLTTICRAASGKSPQELLHERLLTEAKRMLLYTSHPATTIAFMLGFREAAYFSRFFKRGAQMPPGEFRARMRGDRTAPAGPRGRI